MSYAFDKGIRGRMLIGGLLVIVGTLLLLQKMDIFYLDELLGIRSVWSLWPIIFVAMGIGKIADAPTPLHIGRGVWWIFFGVWMYVSINHVYGLSFHETWPAIIIAWGVSVLWESFIKNSRVTSKGYDNGKQ